MLTGWRNPCMVFWLRHSEQEAWPILFFFFFFPSEHRLPINHNHKSATQQHVSLKAVVAHTLGLQRPLRLLNWTKSTTFSLGGLSLIPLWPLDPLNLLHCLMSSLLKQACPCTEFLRVLKIWDTVITGNLDETQPTNPISWHLIFLLKWPAWQPCNYRFCRNVSTSLHLHSVTRIRSLPLSVVSVGVGRDPQYCSPPKCRRQ